MSRISCFSRYLVGNKVRDDADRAFIAAHAGGLEVVATFPIDDRVSEADREGVPVYDAIPEFVAQARALSRLIDAAARPVTDSGARLT